MSDIKKWPPIPEERRKRYEDLFNNSTSFDGVPPDVRAHIERVGSLHGEGIDVIGNLNKDYLGAFMAPFSRDVKYGTRSRDGILRDRTRHSSSLRAASIIKVAFDRWIVVWSDSLP